MQNNKPKDNLEVSADFKTSDGIPFDKPVEDHYNINHSEYLRENTVKSWYNKKCCLSHMLFIPSMQLIGLIRRVIGKPKPNTPKQDSTQSTKYKISSKANATKNTSEKGKVLEVEDLPGVGEREDIQNYVLSLNTCWEN